MKLKQVFSEEEATGLQQLTLLLMMILLCCLCMACCTVMLRLRCKYRNQRVNGEGLDEMAAANDRNIDAETAVRNRILAELRARQAA